MAEPSAPYRAGHIEQALADDDRVGEVDLHVEITGSRLVVTGNVASPGRQAAVAAVLAELVGGELVVTNRVEVMRFATDRAVEELP